MSNFIPKLLNKRWLKTLPFDVKRAVSYYNLARTRTGRNRPVERRRSDYGTELQSRKVDKWLIKQGIVFEPSAPYSQEENGVSERMGRTIMDMVRATILEGNIDDLLWPEIVLAMTHIKNIRPTRSLKGSISPYEMQNKKLPNLHHLRVLGSTVYVFLHEEERSLKSAKWEARALKGTLVGFDGSTIYRVHIEEQNRVVRVKDLRIFEDTVAKLESNLPDFDGKATFEAIQVDESDTTTDSEEDDEIPLSKNATRPPPTKPAPTITRAGRVTKPTPKTAKQGKSQALIIKLMDLLERDWESEEKVSAFLTQLEDPSNERDDGLDPIQILASTINKTSSIDNGDYAFATQLDIEEPETYEKAMSGTHAQQWSHAIQEELHQLEKNNTWELIPSHQMEPGHKALSGKWIFKINIWGPQSPLYPYSAPSGSVYIADSAEIFD